MPKLKSKVLSPEDRKKNDELAKQVAVVNEELQAGVVPGLNGKFYTILETGKVKAVGTIGLNKFIEHNDVFPIEEELAEQNTQVLLKFLRKQIPDTEFSRHCVYIRGYKIRYRSHGYEIVDKWNFSEHVNVNKWNNDFPRPEDVAVFLNKNIKKRKLTSPALPTPPMPGSTVTALSGKFKVAIDKKAGRKKEAERLAKLQEQIKKNEEAIRKRDELVKKDKAKIKKALKPKRVKLFRGTEFDEPIWCSESKGIVNYKIQGPTKKVDRTLPVHVFLVNYLIAEDAFPRAMAMFMRAAKGERFNIDKLSMTKFVLDPYQPYDAKLLLNTKHHKYVRKLAENMFLMLGVPNPLEKLYTTEYKKGEEIRLLFRDIGAWYYATVNNTDRGLNVTLEGGEPQFVFKCTKIERVKIK